MVSTCSAAAAQYGSPGWLAQHPCVSGGALPFTGLNLAWLLIAALALIAVGLVLWSKAWRP